MEIINNKAYIKHNKLMIYYMTEKNQIGINEETKAGTIPVEELPLAERIKLAETVNPYKDLKPGCFVDAKDTVNNWCAAQIIKMEGNEITINYDGWSNKFNDVCNSFLF